MDARAFEVYVPKLCAVGAWIPAAQVTEQELAAHKEMELRRISDNLDQYLLLCAQEKVCQSASSLQLWYPQLSILEMGKLHNNHLQHNRTYAWFIPF